MCVGELRPVKAIDVLIRRLASSSDRAAVTATIAGSPEGRELQAQAHRWARRDQVRFISHCPARAAFTMGRMLVIPSRAESLPYVVLEARRRAPIIATDVGGVRNLWTAAQLIRRRYRRPYRRHHLAIDDRRKCIRTAQTLKRVRSEFS